MGTKQAAFNRSLDKADPTLRRRYPTLEAACETLLREVLEAFKLQRDDIGDSDLDNEQPVSLHLSTSLGTLRKVRMLHHAKKAGA